MGVPILAFLARVCPELAEGVGGDAARRSFLGRFTGTPDAQAFVVPAPSHLV